KNEKRSLPYLSALSYLAFSFRQSDQKIPDGEGGPTAALIVGVVARRADFHQIETGHSWRFPRQSRQGDNSCSAQADRIGCTHSWNVRQLNNVGVQSDVDLTPRECRLLDFPKKLLFQRFP